MRSISNKQLHLQIYNLTDDCSRCHVVCVHVMHTIRPHARREMSIGLRFYGIFTICFIVFKLISIKIIDLICSINVKINNHNSQKENCVCWDHQWIFTPNPSSRNASSHLQNYVSAANGWRSKCRYSNMLNSTGTETRRPEIYLVKCFGGRNSS